MTLDDRDLDVRLRALPTLGNAVPAAVVVGRARSRTLRNRAVAGLALAAVALLVAGLAPTADGVRARGVDLAPAVILEAVADGPGGPRPVDGPLSADEAVVFRVRTAGPGVLTVEADGARLWPAEGALEVGAGTTFVGGDQPLAWTPDRQRAEHTATATLCPSADAPRRSCTTSSVVLTWR